MREDRQSGRTSRMLVKAYADVLRGKRVAVVFPNWREAHDAVHLLQYLTREAPLRRRDTFMFEGPPGSFLRFAVTESEPSGWMLDEVYFDHRFWEDRLWNRREHYYEVWMHVSSRIDERKEKANG